MGLLAARCQPHNPASGGSIAQEGARGTGDSVSARPTNLGHEMVTNCQGLAGMGCDDLTPPPPMSGTKRHSRGTPGTAQNRHCTIRKPQVDGSNPSVGPTHAAHNERACGFSQSLCSLTWQAALPTIAHYRPRMTVLSFLVSQMLATDRS